MPSIPCLCPSDAPCGWGHSAPYPFSFARSDSAATTINDSLLGKLYKLLSAFSTVILVTVDTTGGLRGHPLAAARVDKNTDPRLFTSRDSERVREIKADSLVQVYGQEGWTNCVVLTSLAIVVDSHAMICEVWKMSFKEWFLDGADVPDIVLLQ